MPAPAHNHPTAAVPPHQTADRRGRGLPGLKWGDNSSGATCNTVAEGPGHPAATTCEQQVLDGAQMGKYAREHDVGHVMLLGDNFYGSGIHGDTSNCRFQKTFEARRLICLCSVSSVHDDPPLLPAGHL